jgi:hypothetical protein
VERKIMAINSGSTPTVMSYLVEDELGVSASTRAWINYDGAAETVQALIGEWLSYGGLLDASTDGKIVGGRITIELIPDPSWKASPAAGSRVEQNAVLNVTSDNNSHKTAYVVPAVKNSLLTGSFPNFAINVTSGAIKALGDAIKGGFTNGNFSTLGGLAATKWVDALFTFRKHRKQLSRVSVRDTTAD